MHANTANEDAQRNIMKYSAQVRELQRVLEEEQTRKEQLQDDFENTEKRLVAAQSEKAEIAAKALQVNPNRSARSFQLTVGYPRSEQSAP